MVLPLAEPEVRVAPGAARHGVVGHPQHAAAVVDAAAHAAGGHGGGARRGALLVLRLHRLGTHRVRRGIVVLRSKGRC